LALTSGEAAATLANDGLVALGQAGDEVVGRRGPRCLLDFEI